MWCDYVGGDGLFWVGGIAEEEWEWGEVGRGEEGGGEGEGDIRGADDGEGRARRIYKGELGAKGGINSTITGDNLVNEGSISIKAVNCAAFQDTDVLDLQMGFFRWELFRIGGQNSSYIFKYGVCNAILDVFILWWVGTSQHLEI